jgi:uncharacterized protein affecting Mg2+/Co2+ transport
MYAGVAPFEYCSCTYLVARRGRMWGSFTFQITSTGEEFDAIVGMSFSLPHPSQCIHLLNLWP